MMCYVISTFKSKENANSDSARTTANEQCSAFFVPYDSLLFYEDATGCGQVNNGLEKEWNNTLATRAKTHSQQLY